MSMRTEQLEAILVMLKEAGQEKADLFFEDNGESIPVVATIKNSGVVKDNLISLVFYKK